MASEQAAQLIPNQKAKGHIPGDARPIQPHPIVLSASDGYRAMAAQKVQFESLDRRNIKDHELRGDCGDPTMPAAKLDPAMENGQQNDVVKATQRPSQQFEASQVETLTIAGVSVSANPVSFPVDHLAPDVRQPYPEGLDNSKVRLTTTNTSKASSDTADLAAHLAADLSKILQTEAAISDKLASKITSWEQLEQVFDKPHKRPIPRSKNSRILHFKKTDFAKKTDSAIPTADTTTREDAEDLKLASALMKLAVSDEGEISSPDKISEIADGPKLKPKSKLNSKS